MKTLLINLWQTLLKGSLAALAILLAGYATEYLLNQPQNPFLLASMGASGVILFALPQSPMARPWAVIGGHLLSAITGITCAALLRDIHLAAAVAAGTSLLVMSLARCVHPPGGATALLAVLGGEGVQASVGLCISTDPCHQPGRPAGHCPSLQPGSPQGSAAFPAHFLANRRLDGCPE